MDALNFSEQIYWMAFLYIIDLIILVRFAAKINFITLIVWPTAIYAVGPCLSLAFYFHPALSKYVFPDLLVEESELFATLLILTLAIEEKWKIGNIIGKYLLGADIIRLGESKITLWTFYIIGCICSIFQILEIMVYGSVFSGNYVGQIAISDTSGNQPISWGVLAGFYELFFSCTVVLFIAKRNENLMSKESFLYGIVLLLRLIGGTRLIIIKELSILMFLMISQGKIKFKSVIIFSACVIFLGTMVGVARSGGKDEEFGAIGSFFYETSLNALTLNIADHLSHDQLAYTHYHPIDAALTVAFSVVPTFIKNVIIGSENSASGVGVTPMATESGFDTASPVGGMALFSSSIYLFFNPWIGPILYPISLLLFVKIKFNRQLKSYLMVAIISASMNIWRDPLDLSVKVIFQTVLLYLFLGNKWKIFDLSTESQSTVASCELSIGCPSDPGR